MKQPKFTVRFGCLSDSIQRQLLTQGFQCSDLKLLTHYQTVADGLARASLFDVMTESAVAKARRKLGKLIGEIVHV